MEFQLRPARRGALYARLLLYGESGHGKTYTALAVAFHLAELYGFSPEQIAVLDTETVESADRNDEGTGSAEKYAGRPCNCNRCHRQGLTLDGFQTMIMVAGSRGPDEFMRALKVCAQAGIKVLLIDGITDEWRSLLMLVDALKARSHKDDPWATARPKHNAFMRALMEYPGHVIATCRGKKENRHKKAEQGMGDVLPDQDSNIIYDFDLALLCKQGTGHVVKTRDDRLHGATSQHPGADLAEGLKRWCDDPRAATKAAGAAKAPTPPTPPAAQVPPTAPNTTTDALAPLFRDVEANVQDLIELGEDEAAEKSLGYAKANRGNRAALLQVLDRQGQLIARAKAARAEAPAQGDLDYPDEAPADVAELPGAVAP